MIYGLGDLPDAPKPEADRRATFKRYYQNHKTKIHAKRKENAHRYKETALAAQRRLRAKKRLVTNPFIQLNMEMFNDLRRRASKGIQGKLIQKRTPDNTGNGECP